jgi:hypothetical protein
MSRAESIGFQTPRPVYFLLMQYHYEMPSKYMEKYNNIERVAFKIG